MESKAFRCGCFISVDTHGGRMCVTSTHFCDDHVEDNTLQSALSQIMNRMQRLDTIPIKRDTEPHERHINRRQRLPE